MNKRNKIEQILMELEDKIGWIETEENLAAHRKAYDALIELINEEEEANK